MDASNCSNRAQSRSYGLDCMCAWARLAPREHLGIYISTRSCDKKNLVAFALQLTRVASMIDRHWQGAWWKGLITWNDGTRGVVSDGRRKDCNGRLFVAATRHVWEHAQYIT